MRELNLEDYQWTQPIMNPVTGGATDVTMPYKVKDSILNIMFLPSLGLQGAALVKQNVLAMKIEQCQVGRIVLEEEEYQRILAAANTYKAQSRADVQLIDRILNQTPEN